MASGNGATSAAGPAPDSSQAPGSGGVMGGLPLPGSQASAGSMSPHPHFSQQRASPMPAGARADSAARSSIPPSAASPASTQASASSVGAVTPVQPLAANAQPHNGLSSGAASNGGSRPSTATSTDDRGQKRVKTEHEAGNNGAPDGPFQPQMGAPMGYTGPHPGMPYMMPPGYGPPGSMPPNGQQPGAFQPQPGMMPGYPGSFGNGAGQLGYPPPPMQFQGYPGGPGGPMMGNMGPPMWMPGAGFPTAEQQQAGSNASTPLAGPSTPGQYGGEGSTDKPPKPKKPRVKKEAGEKGKQKSAGPESQAATAEGSQAGTPQPGAMSVDTPASVDQYAMTPQAQTPQANQPAGAEPPKKVKGKPGPKKKEKGEHVEKRKYVKKKDKLAQASGDTPGTGASVAGTPGPSSAIPDEISAVQSLLASSGVLPQQPQRRSSEAGPSSAAQSSGTGAAIVAEGQQTGAAAPLAAPAVEASGDNVDSLQDLLGMSGVDLQAEEAAIQTGGTAQPAASAAAASAAMQRPDALEGRPSPFFLELYALSFRIHRMAARNGLRVEPEVLLYLSNAAKLRFRNLLEAMVSASRHRAWSSHLRAPPHFERSGKPMYHEELLDDPQKLLSALTRVEKAEEQASRQRRILRDERAASAAAGAVNGDTDMAEEGVESGITSGAGTPGAAGVKKPSSSSRNMTEDKRLKLANKTAAQALGISSTSKSWMFGTGDGGSSAFGAARKDGEGGPSRLPKPRFAPQASADNTASPGQEKITQANGKASEPGPNPKSSQNTGGWGDVTARRRQREDEERRRARLVNLEDALHALDMERSGGAGRGSGERALYVARALGRPYLPSKAKSDTQPQASL